MQKNPLSFLIAPDKFKGSLQASKVAKAIADGIRDRHPKASIFCQPMADGGDGSLDLLSELWDLREYQLEVNDPLFRQTRASYYASQDKAYIEMAQASGLTLLQAEERDCLKTTSLGTGELIRDAVERGFGQINLFIGGSATNDAAMGIASALGYRFTDANGQVLSPIGENLGQVARIEASELSLRIRKVKIRIVCDVNNPFHGKNGAAHVYAAQKGADEVAIKHLDAGLRHLDGIFEKSGYGSIQSLPGSGAAGGVGGGMAALLGAKLISGIGLFIDLFDLEEKVKQADVVITGEGRLDSQSFQGKVVGGMLKLCKKHEKPLIIVCGQQQLEGIDYDRDTISQVVSLVDYAPSVEEAMSGTAVYLREIGAKMGW
jgi:glycerate kinase